jgi:hypothetical protein
MDGDGGRAEPLWPFILYYILHLQYYSDSRAAADPSSGRALPARPESGATHCAWPRCGTPDDAAAAAGVVVDGAPLAEPYARFRSFEVKSSVGCARVAEVRSSVD